MSCRYDLNRSFYKLISDICGREEMAAEWNSGLICLISRKERSCCLGTTGKPHSLMSHKVFRYFSEEVEHMC